MKSTLRTIMICACSIYSFVPSIVYAQDSEGETVTIDGANYYTEMPVRFFLNYNDIGERLGFYSAGGLQLKSSGLDVESNLRKDDQKRWSDELCESYIYPECLKILNNNSKNATISFVLGILNFTGILHSNRSKNTNFLDPDVEKSKYFVNRAADLGLPDALNFRALMNGVDWGKALDQDDFQEPPSVELDLKAAVGKNYNPAKLNFAALYMDRKKYDEARVIYEDLSKNEMAEGDIALGVIYLAGYGVSRDFVKAREYFSKALTKKSAMGKKVSYNLGMMYFKGHGGSVDYKLASQWVGYAASTNDKLELAVAALPKIDQARQAAADKLKLAVVAKPMTDQEKQNHTKIMAAIDALRPGESVQIRVPARPSPAGQNGPRYDPNCKLQYIELTEAERTIPTTTDIYVVRVPANIVSQGQKLSEPFLGVDFYSQFFESKANAYATFSEKYNSEKPVMTCKIERNNSKRGISEFCQNNYTGVEFEPNQGLGISIDKNGNITEISCSYCIEDKSGKKFSIGRKPGKNFDLGRLSQYKPSNFRKIVDENGRWRGAIATYTFEYWRGYQGNADFLATRTVQDGYSCSFTAPPSFNF